MNVVASFAKEHNRIAISLIIILSTLLSTFAFVAGMIWSMMNYSLSKYLIVVVSIVMLFSAFYYYKYSLGYFQKKIAIFILYQGTIILFFNGGFEQMQNAETPINTKKSPVLLASIAHPILQDTPFLRKVLKKHKKSIRIIIQKIASKKWGIFGRTLLMILVLIVLAGLGILLAMLSCSLLCAGYGVASVAVLLGGAGLITWLGIIIIKAIWKKYRKPKVISQNIQ
jgi:hypothetical protein